MSKKKFAAKNIPGKSAENKKQIQNHSGKKEIATYRKQWIVFAALAIFTFIVFYPSLKCEFTNWDDGTYVTENPMIWKLDGNAIKEIFTTPISLNYHPLTMLSLAIDYKMSKPNPGFYNSIDPYYFHLNNVIIHILNTLLVFIFIRLLTQGYNRKIKADDFRPDPFIVGLIVAVLFAIHPMHVESVTWVAERKDVLYGFFFLLSIIFYLKHLDHHKQAASFLGRYSFFIWSFVFFILTCLSKGMGVVLPVILVLIDWFYGEARTLKQIFQSALQKAHYFLAALAFGIVAYKIQSQGAIAAMETFSLFQRLTFGCYGFIMYIYKLIIPVNLSAFYPYPFTDAEGNIPAIYYASPFIVLFIILVILVFLRKSESAGKILAFGFSFYFIAIVLVLQFLSVGSVIMADRYSYLSYIGLFFMIGYFFEYFKKSFKSYSLVVTVILIAVTGIYSYLTYERTKVWTNAETLWTDALNQFPFIEIGYENRGIYYKDHNQLDKMLKDYEFVTEKLNSKNEKIWSNLGNLYGLLQQFDKSLNAYSKAIEYNPSNASTYLNRAITLSMMGQYEKSIPDYDKSIELDPSVALNYKNRAYTLLQLGQFEKSIRDYDKALELYAYDTLSYLNRGISKFNAKMFPEAIADFNKYIGMSPNNPQAYFNNAIAYKNMGKYPEALQNALMAQKLGRKIDPELLNELTQKAK